MDKTVENLAAGETLLVSAKGSKGGKVQLQFAEHIKSPYAKTSRSKSGKLNKSDSRFSGNKPRRAWMGAEPSDAKDMFGIDVSGLAEGEEKILNILNPLDATENNERCRLEVTETTTPDEYQKENTDTSAKRAGKSGPFILYGGKKVWGNVDVVGEIVRHTFLEPDTDDAPSEGAPIEGTVEAEAESLQA